jgi:hypothetical protein
MWVCIFCNLKLLFVSPFSCSVHHYTNNNKVLNLVMDKEVNEPLIHAINSKALNRSCATTSSSSSSSHGALGFIDPHIQRDWEERLTAAIQSLKTQLAAQGGSSSDRGEEASDNSSRIRDQTSMSNGHQRSSSNKGQSSSSSSRPLQPVGTYAKSEAEDALDILTELLENKQSPKVLIPEVFRSPETQEALAMFLSDMPTERIPVEHLFRVALAKLQLDRDRKPLTLR